MTTVGGELEAVEERLFAHYGLTVERQMLELRDGPVGRVRALSVGDGPAVVLFHGGGMCASLWAPLLPYLEGYRVVAVDLPGCGLTAAFSYGDGDLRDHAADFVAGVLGALGLDSAVLGGNSLGGMYALYAAARRPGLAEALVIIGEPAVALPGARATLPMALYSRPLLGRTMSRLLPRPTPSQARRFFAFVGGTPSTEGHPEVLWESVALATDISASTNASLFPRLFRWRTPRPEVVLTAEELQSIDVPTLFVWGDEDIFLGPAAGEDAVSSMPDASLEVVAGGHHPWFDDPRGCSERVRAFLDRVAATG